MRHDPASAAVVVDLPTSAGKTILAEFKIVQRAIAQAFPAVNVRVRLAYPALKEAAERDIASVSELLIELVKHESPGSAPFLLNSSTDFSLANGVFTVRATGEEGVSYMQARNVDKLLSDILRELFGIEARTVIEVAGSEQKRLQRIREERLREEARMAAEAAREWASASERRAVVIAGSVVLAGEAVQLAAAEDWKDGWQA